MSDPTPPYVNPFVPEEPTAPAYTELEKYLLRLLFSGAGFFYLHGDNQNVMEVTVGFANRTTTKAHLSSDGNLKLFAIGSKTPHLDYTFPSIIEATRFMLNIR